MDVIASLPTELTTSIIAEWLEVREVGLLDSACVSLASRTSLKVAFASPQCVLVGWPKQQSANKYMQWICRKEIRVENVIITPTMAYVPLVDNLRKFGQVVKCMKACQISYFSEQRKKLFDFERVVISCKLCDNLTTLFCNQLEITDSIFDVLKSCPLIQHLHFTRCSRVVDSEVSATRCDQLHHVQLRSLVVQNCTLMDNCVEALVASVAPHCLERLAAPQLRNVYHTHPQQFTQLTAVGLADWSLFGDDDPLMQLASFSARLTHLDVAKWGSAIDIPPADLLQKFPNLQTVNLVASVCDFFAVSAILALADASPKNLKQLFIEHRVDSETTAEHLKYAYDEIVLKCPNLHTLSSVEINGVPVQFHSCLFHAFAALCIESEISDSAVACFQYLQRLRCSVDPTTFKAFDFTLLTAQRLPALRTLVLVLVGDVLTVNPTIAALQAMRSELHITRDASVLEYDFMKVSSE